MKYDQYNLAFEDFFTYHPVVSDERQIKHDAVNEAAMLLGKCVWELLDPKDPERNEFLAKIQYIRMMLNQQVTIDEVIKLKTKK